MDNSNFLTSELTAPAFADRPLDRRQLIKAGVWAAPAIVLVTAVPAAAASLVYSAVSVIAEPLSGGSYRSGQINMNNGGIKYDYRAWGLPGQSENKGPATVTVAYNCDLLDSTTNVVVRNISTNASAVIPKYQSTRIVPTITNVPAGSYKLRLTVSAAVFSANTLGATFKAVLPQVSTSSTITVR